MPIIAVTSSKGGVGKTTTCYNLALALNPDTVLDQDTHTGLRVLAQLRDSPLPFDLRHYDDTRGMLDALRKLHTDGQTVLVDVGGYDSDIARAVIAVAELVIVPTNDTPTDRIGLARFNIMLEEVSIAVGRTITAKVLICKAHPSQKKFPDIESDLSKSKYLSRLQTVIASRPDHYRSHKRGLGVTERPATRHTAAGKEITALVEEIRNELGQKVE